MAEDLSEHYYTHLDRKNMSFIISESFDNDVSAQPNQDYEQFLADVWVGIVLTLMVLSCICCMCSCLLYHKFQQWKRNVLETRNPVTVETGNIEAELPSYTIASGLPTYQEALEQLKKVKELTKKPENIESAPKPTSSTPLSVVNLFQLYKSNGPSPKPS